MQMIIRFEMYCTISCEMALNFVHYSGSMFNHYAGLWYTQHLIGFDDRRKKKVIPSFS